MLKRFAVILASMIALVAVLPLFAQNRPSLVSVLADDVDGRFTTLVAALEAAGLTETLEGEGQFTVFAPTNDAIAAALAERAITVDDLLADTELLSSILTYHVVPERLAFRHLTRGGEFVTVNGESLSITLEGGFLTLNGTAHVTDLDNLASNGVVHVIDNVLFPSEATGGAEATAEPATTEETVITAPPTRPNLVEVLTTDADGRFSILSAAIEAAGLTDLLSSGDNTYTLFAPTDEAIETALSTLGVDLGVLVNNTEWLTSIIRYHILPERLTFRNLTRGGTFETWNGMSIDITLEGGFLTLNGTAHVTDLDNLASNGVVHVIDGLLVPADILSALAPAVEATPEPVATEEPVVVAPPARPNLVQVLSTDADSRFSLLSAALGAAGMTDALSGEGQFTLFAPTDEAITTALSTLGISQETILGNMDMLTSILQYHVVPERLAFRNLTRGGSFETLNGTPVDITLEGGFLTLNSTAHVTDLDNLASNGVVHVIDGLLVPADILSALAPAVEATPEPVATEEPVVVAPPARPNLVQVLSTDADSRFSLLSAALGAAGLTDALSGEGQFTLFAPTDEAITTALSTLGISQETILGNMDMLTSILQYHVVPERLAFRNLTRGGSFETLNGTPVDITLEGGFLTLNGTAHVTDLDNLASNGVVHVIDGLLVPADILSALAPAVEATPEPVATEEPVVEEPATAYVRFANFSNDSGVVTVLVNDTARPSTLTFPTLTNWIEVDSGANNFSFTNADGNTVALSDVTLAAGSYTTIALSGSVANGAGFVQPFTADFGSVGADQAHLTMVYTVVGGVPVDVFADDTNLVVSLAYPNTLDYANDGVFEATLVPGTYTINVVPSAGGDAVVSVPGQTFEAGRAYVLTLFGTPDGYRLTTVQAAVPASE